ncbi:hypothetical protein ACH427_04515 [Streptomyces sp. NPDC020379]|uniref:hypothetical protein n=1 Tax=Streptomyces sp. NPDC020379 TaxID=3365071 RepID=UPI00378BF48E
MSKSGEWLRPEFKDRWDELISSKEVLSLTGLTSQKFAAWRRRQAVEPKPVCKVIPGKGIGAQYYYVKSELESLFSEAPEITAAQYEAALRDQRERQIRIDWFTQQEELVEKQLAQIRAEKAKLNKVVTKLRPIVEKYERDHNISR